LSKRTRSSRKRRPAATSQAQRVGSRRDADGEARDKREERRSRRATHGGEASDKREERRSRRATHGGGPISVTPTHGERPRPPWHPLPLAEVLILVGVVALVLAFEQGVENHYETLLAGIAAIALGTLEATIREHRSGYRSHTTMLAALPVLIFHSVTLLIVSILTSASRYINLGLFAVDLVLFVLLFRLMRSSFLTARARVSSR
jgi:hypothetical protein